MTRLTLSRRKHLSNSTAADATMENFADLLAESFAEDTAVSSAKLSARRSAKFSIVASAAVEFDKCFLRESVSLVILTG